MNQSGDSVKKILKEKGLKIEDALIVHDDSDIHIGEYKFHATGARPGTRGSARYGGFRDAGFYEIEDWDSPQR